MERDAPSAINTLMRMCHGKFFALKYHMTNTVTRLSNRYHTIFKSSELSVTVCLTSVREAGMAARSPNISRGFDGSRKAVFCRLLAFHWDRLSG